MPDTVLVVDDEELFRLCLCAHLEKSGYRVLSAPDGEKALALVNDHRPDIVLMDIEMPRIDGLTALRRLRRAHPRVPVILCTAHGRVEAAIKAARLGARAFLTKPFDLREASQTVAKVLAESRATRDGPPGVAGAFDGLIGNSAPMQRVRALLEKARAAGPATVLVEGPAGSGKSLVAELWHRASSHKDGPLVTFDANGLSEDDVELSLFGHWSAEGARRGVFERAEGGTLVLDEVTHLSPRAQNALLRALDTRNFRRVGGLVDIPIRCTVIATSRRSVRSEAHSGRFNEALYYRLALVVVPLPPLADRRDDVPQLAEALVQRAASEHGRDVRGIGPAAMQMLTQHSWAGNVAELRASLERSVVLSAGGVLEVNDLQAEVRAPAEADARDCPFDLPERGVPLAVVERGLVLQALGRCRGNERAAANLLGLSLQALRERMARHGITPADRAPAGEVALLNAGEDPDDTVTYVPFARERAG